MSRTGFGRALMGAGLTLAALSACSIERKEQPEEQVQLPPATATVAMRTPADSSPTKAPDTVATPVSTPAPMIVSYGDAERVFRTGDYETAAELFDAYAERRPENPWGHYMLGISAWRAGDHGRAETALRKTLEVSPDHGKGLINLARVLLEQRKASDALEYAERVVELDSTSGEGWRVLGNARSDIGLVDDAVAAYRQALVIEHRDAWTMNNLGLLMIREGRYEEALRPLARATELRPDVAVFQNNLGVALERTGQPVAAVSAFRAALEAKPEYEKARISLERVESRAAEPTVEPVDLTGLAREFADEVEGWKIEGLPGTGSQPGDSAAFEPHEC